MAGTGHCANWWSWSRGLVAATTALGLSAGTAAAATLSGTVHYGGSQGPVSASHPIGVLVSDQADLGGNQLVSLVSTNGGAFNVNVSPGTYYLGVFLDLENVGVPVVGEPYEIYNQRSTLPADPIAVSANGVSGLALDFNDTHRLSGIFGTVSYTGHLGQVTKSTRIEVFGYTDAALTTSAGLESNSKSNGGPYEIVTLDTNTYYLLAFLDLNGNGAPDTGEPFEIYNGKGAPPADPVVAGPTQTNINFAFGDTHLLPVPTLGSGATVTATPPATPTPTPTATPTRGTPPPTPTLGLCVGDCNGDGVVAINELVVGVSIALGLQPVTACEAFANQSGAVDIAQLVRAVTSALAGCRTA